MKIGQHVYWHDPANGECSGYGKVASVNGEIIGVDKADGGYVEALRHEIRTAEQNLVDVVSKLMRHNVRYINRGMFKGQRECHLLSPELDQIGAALSICEKEAE